MLSNAIQVSPRKYLYTLNCSLGLRSHFAYSCSWSLKIWCVNKLSFSFRMINSLPNKNGHVRLKLRVKQLQQPALILCRWSVFFCAHLFFLPSFIFYVYTFVRTRIYVYFILPCWSLSTSLNCWLILFFPVDNLNFTASILQCVRTYILYRCWICWYAI